MSRGFQALNNPDESRFQDGRFTPLNPDEETIKIFPTWVIEAGHGH